jgi:hypothetical protein
VITRGRKGWVLVRLRQPFVSRHGPRVLRSLTDSGTPSEATGGVTEGIIYFYGSTEREREGYETPTLDRLRSWEERPWALVREELAP